MNLVSINFASTINTRFSSLSNKYQLPATFRLNKVLVTELLQRFVAHSQYLYIKKRIFNLYFLND